MNSPSDSDSRPDLDAEIAQAIAAESEVLPFLIQPAPIACLQGTFTYAAIALARHEGRVLFVDSQTRQFGVAVGMPGDGINSTQAQQYPTLKLALKVFSSARNFPDEEDHFGPTVSNPPAIAPLFPDEAS